MTAEGVQRLSQSLACVRDRQLQVWLWRTTAQKTGLLLVKPTLWIKKAQRPRKGRHLRLGIATCASHACDAWFAFVAVVAPCTTCTAAKNSATSLKLH